MKFESPLIPATLVRRYKRFLADCVLSDGKEIVAHCPNPGSMMGLADKGTKVWLEPRNGSQKLKYGWRLVEHENGQFTGIDTSVPNRALKAALENQDIPEFARYENVRPEVRYGENSRIDFLLTNPGLPDCYIEVKSVTLMRRPGLAEFPDSVTQRGTKHLGELTKMVQQGHRAVMLYLVQRTGCDRFQLAADIDPKYAQASESAKKNGVECLIYSTCISPDEITISAPIDGPVSDSATLHISRSTGHG